MVVVAVIVFEVAELVEDVSSLADVEVDVVVVVF